MKLLLRKCTCLHTDVQEPQEAGFVFISVFTEQYTVTVLSQGFFKCATLYRKVVYKHFDHLSLPRSIPLAQDSVKEEVKSALDASVRHMQHR